MLLHLTASNTNNLPPTIRARHDRLPQHRLLVPATPLATVLANLKHRPIRAGREGINAIAAEAPVCVPGIRPGLVACGEGAREMDIDGVVDETEVVERETVFEVDEGDA